MILRKEEKSDKLIVFDSEITLFYAFTDNTTTDGKLSKSLGNEKI